MDEKETLHHYLRVRRSNLLGKLDGLSEYDVRRPLTPTGTNLLGLVKHVASVELGYFGEVFGRPSGRPLPWLDEDASPEVGHANILRELIDGSAGQRPGDANLTPRSPEEWAAHRAAIEAAARKA